MKQLLRKMSNVGAVALLIVCLSTVGCKTDVKESSEAAKVEISPKDYNSKLSTYQKKTMGKYSLRSGGEDNEEPTFRDTISNAINLSVLGKYEDSKKVLFELLGTHPENEEIVMQIAIQDFYIGNYKESINRLNELVKSSDNEVRYESEMILAQASLALDDNYSTSKKWLSKISSEPKHPYFADAKNQLKMME